MGQAASKQEDFWEACCYGRLHLVKKHIEEGIDVNWVSYTHDSCAIHVASQGKPEVVEMLLDANCDVNAQDNRGNLAIHHAAMRGHSDILRTLIDAKSDINGQEKNGWTALHCAAYWCQPKAVDVLIKKGSDVSIQNKDQRTALHEVARSQETSEPNLGDITRTLIDAGCNINAKSSDEGEADFTPLMFAAYHGHPEIAMALLDAGCEMNSYGTNLWTALHWAADRDNEEVVYMLLEAGADPTLRGLRGELAADRAKTKELGDTLYNAYNMHCELASLDVKSSPTKFVPRSAAKIGVPINSSISTHMPKGNFNATVHINKRTAVGGEDVVTAATNEQHVSNIKALLAICQRRQKEKALKAKVKADAVNYNASGNVDETIAKDKDTDHSNTVKPVEKTQIGSITEVDGKKQCDPLSCIDAPDQMHPSRVPETLDDASNNTVSTIDEENCNNLSTSNSHVVSFDHSSFIDLSDQMRDSSPSRVPESLEDAASSAAPTQGGKETNSTSTSGSRVSSTDCSCCSDSTDRMHDTSPGPEGRGDNSDSSIHTQDETECNIVPTADSPSTPTADSQNASTSDSQSIPLGLVQTESVDENKVDEIAEPANKSSSSDMSDEHTSDIVLVETDSSTGLSENMLDNKPEEELVCLESEMSKNDVQLESDPTKHDEFQ